MKDILINIILGFSSIFFVSIFWKNPIFLTFILFIISFLFLFYFRDKSKIVLFFLCGFLGIIAEVIAIYFGAWNYSISNFLNIPYWLFPLWGIASIFMVNIYQQLSKYFN